MEAFRLHKAVKDGDLSLVEEILAEPSAANAIDQPDRRGLTPLNYAVIRNEAGVEILRSLIHHGAKIDHESLVFALKCLNGPEKLKALIEGGADIRYQTAAGYDALIDASYQCRNAYLTEVLSLLIAKGVSVNGRGESGETALRQVWRTGRSEAARLLLNAGANPEELLSTALINAVGFGSVDEVKAAIESGGSFEERDSWGRTPWHIAIQMGDIEKAKLLLAHGADRNATGRGLTPALFYAVESGHESMTEWLIQLGVDVEQTDQNGHTALFQAVESDNANIVELLLRAGANASGETKRIPWHVFVERLPEKFKSDNEFVELLQRQGASGNREIGGKKPIEHAQSAGVAKKLLDAGADPKDLQLSQAGEDDELRRQILGLPPDPAGPEREFGRLRFLSDRNIQEKATGKESPSHENLRASIASHIDQELFDLAREEFERNRSHRFGTTNPERMNNPFWDAMVRSGIQAYEPRYFFGVERIGRESPVWCAYRYGQTITFLEDGRIVQTGGEHEDSYDPDFCIYNDVFVHHSEGRFDIYGYPESIFPPTDFHTATLCGEYIYLIGSLGYAGSRQYGKTPVYRLHTGTFAIEPLETSGEAPGWIYKHRAIKRGSSEIHVSGGKIVTLGDQKEVHAENNRSFLFDTERLFWRVAD